MSLDTVASSTNESYVSLSQQAGSPAGLKGDLNMRLWIQLRQNAHFTVWIVAIFFQNVRVPRSYILQFFL